MNEKIPDAAPPAEGHGWRTATIVLGAALLILIGGFCTMFARGWKLQRQQGPAGNQRGALGGSSASVEKWSPPLGPGESSASRVKRLAHDVASLSLASTNRPDPSKVLAEAQDLAAKGQYEEALQRHIWYHNHALEYGPSQAGVRLSFALAYWVDLGRKYPKATQALIEIRDRDRRELVEGKGDFALFQEVTAINGQKKSEDDTVALFKTVLEQDPKLAQQCYPLVEDLLVQNGAYEICLGLIPDPMARFNAIVQERDRIVKLTNPNAQFAAMQHKYFDERFVRQTKALIEILVASGRKPEAEKIQAQSLTVMDDPALASAVQDIEKKLGK